MNIPPNLQQNIGITDHSTRSRSQLSPELLKSCKEELMPEDADKMGSVKRWQMVVVAQAKIIVLIVRGKNAGGEGDISKIGGGRARDCSYKP
jgi:hypothetical protein